MQSRSEGGVKNGSLASLSDDPLNLDRLTLVDNQIPERRVSAPRKVQKRRQHFIMVPWAWFERLNGAHGQIYRVALFLLYLNWKDKGRPIKLTNGMLRSDGVSRQSKWRALHELERRGLISVQRRPNRTPVVCIKLSHP